MNVICTKSSSRLIKGATYKCVNINNNNIRKSPYFRPTIRIYLTSSSIQTFPLTSFKPIDSDKFSEINWICPDYQLYLNEREQTKIDSSLKAGDYVVPIFDNLKTLIKGRQYKVVDVQKDEKTSWGNIRIKLEGSYRFYASWNFRKCTSQESREIGLNQLFDEQTNTEKVNKHKRKFDYYSDDEKKVLLLKFITESSNDRFRHQSSIIEWAILKSAIKYKLTKEDFDCVLDLKVSELLEILK
jgi:hypothetical protein